jgi:hypothetical protein
LSEWPDLILRSGRKLLLRTAYHWVAQFADPIRAYRAARNVMPFVRDYRRYSGMADAGEAISLLPSLHERAQKHELDSHYFYLNAWAMRRIVDTNPHLHVDVASQTVLPALLSSVIPVLYVDYRPLPVSLSHCEIIAGNALVLPFRDSSVTSLSCLHAAEHIGLGRYGDPLDPQGTSKAARELCRVLRSNGNLFFAVPIGRERTCFNSHRIHTARTIRQYFRGMELLEYSGVSDCGRFSENVSLAAFDEEEYACGMFWLRKP